MMMRSAFTHGILRNKKVELVRVWYNNQMDQAVLLRWARAFEESDRRVAVTVIWPSVRVSTVFLGINHGWGESDVWFETMVFGGPCDEYCRRYSTYEQAVSGHEMVVEKVRRAGP